SEGALGWYAVYGHVLATTLALAAVWHVARRPAEASPFGWRAATLWWLLLLASSASFGVGIGMALVFPGIVLLLAGRRGLGPAAAARVRPHGGRHLWRRRPRSRTSLHRRRLDRRRPGGVRRALPLPGAGGAQRDALPGARLDRRATRGPAAPRRDAARDIHRC